jgi:protein-disulfide isomerase
MPRIRRTTRSTKAKVDDTPQEAPRRKIGLGFLSKINIVYVLFFLLIIASFLIGVLFTQVQFLRNGTVAGTNDVVLGDETGNNQPTGPVDVDEGHLPILGNKDAKVTVVEFSDFQCPFCEQLFTESLGKIKEEYADTGKIKFAYRHFPLTDIHPNAQKAAEASECANEQGNFWDYHDQLFANQKDWEALSEDQALEKYVEYANAIGLNGESLRECVNSDKMAGKVQDDIDAAIKAGVSGTPATFVNGMLVSGAVPYEEFKAQIDAALEKAN